MQISREAYNAIAEVLNTTDVKERIATRTRMLKLIESMEVIDQDKPVETKNARSNAQNRGLHLGMQFIADELNNAGYDMRKVLKQEIDIPWTKDSVKEYIVKPVMKAMYGHESTTQLKKVEEIDKVWDTIMRHLGEKCGIEYVPFPSDDVRQWEQLGGYKTQAGQADNYPEYDPAIHEPTI